MNKQKLLNQFVRDLCAFIERYYSTGVQSVNLVEMDGYIKGIIEEPTGDALQICSEYEEIIICYGESHWHINCYGEPGQYQEIYREAIQSVFEVLDGKLITYSGRAGQRFLGGGTLSCNIEEEIAYRIAFFKCYEEFTEVVIKVWGSERMHFPVSEWS